MDWKNPFGTETLPSATEAETPDDRGDRLPLGWPDGEPKPSWWPEAVGWGIPFRAARPQRCGGCGFQVAIEWQAADGRWRWSCPGCGRDSDALTPAPGPDFSTWVQRLDCKGRLGWEPPDLDEATRWWQFFDFDKLPVPGEPCPDCGSLEQWWDVAGGEHCGRCEARALARSLDLTDRAARLRRIARPARGEAGPTAETASRLAPCCEGMAPDDGGPTR